MARHNVDLVFRNARRRPRWVLAVAKRETRGMIVSMVSGPQRLAQILAVITGTVHRLVRPGARLPRWLKRVISCPRPASRESPARHTPVGVGEADPSQPVCRASSTLSGGCRV